MEQYLRPHIEEFFSSVGTWRAAIGEPSFAYAAVRSGDNFDLVQARLLVGSINPFSPYGLFETKNVKAGHFALKEVRLDAEGMVEQLLLGICPTPAGSFAFRANESGNFGGYYQPFHADGVAKHERIGVLTILGGSIDLRPPRVLELDWELKGHTEPYDNLQELYTRFRLGTVRTDVASVEVAALGILAVDLSTRIEGTNAEIAVRMSDRAEPNLVTVSYRVINGDTVTRGYLGSSGLTWGNAEGGIRRGAATIAVPEAAVVQVYAAYGGVVLHQAWVFDPDTAQNTRHVTYSRFDTRLAAIAELLAKPAGRGNAREFESAVAWLLWMLGFSPAHLGMVSRLQEAPDILATTPYGHFVVLECTTGPLKTDNKLPLLVERAEGVRAALAASGNRHLKVLPAIVTSKRRIEVRADIEQAERLGVLVITAETLNSALPRTLLRPDADRVFAEGEESVANGLAKYNISGGASF